MRFTRAGKSDVLPTEIITEIRLLKNSGPQIVSSVSFEIAFLSAVAHLFCKR